MSRLFFYKNFRIFVFLFFISTVSVAAQESNIYKEMLKESLGKDFIKKNIVLELDSNLNRRLLLYKMNALLPNRYDTRFKEITPKLSPYLTSFSYKNYKGKPYDTGKFNRDGSFSGVFALTGDKLMSKAACGTINIFGLISLVASHYIPTFIPAKKESKKAKMLRTIKNDVYHIDE